MNTDTLKVWIHELWDADPIPANKHEFDQKREGLALWSVIGAVMVLITFSLGLRELIHASRMFCWILLAISYLLVNWISWKGRAIDKYVFRSTLFSTTLCSLVVVFINANY